MREISGGKGEGRGGELGRGGAGGGQVLIVSYWEIVEIRPLNQTYI